MRLLYKEIIPEEALRKILESTESASCFGY